MPRCILLIALGLSACAPDQVGQQVGQSLYDASVSTGHALATFGDRTGQVLQNAGANLRDTVAPAPAYAAPLQLPPPGAADGYGAPVTAEPLGPSETGTPEYDPYRDGPRDTPPNPSIGY